MPSLRQIRLSTGLVLYLYVTLHFANHALGNISIDAMEGGLVVQKAIWQSPPGAAILYLSALTHMSLGFWALYQRRRFRWTRLEATQLVLGLSIPFLLTSHVIGTRVALSQFGIEKGYAQELLNFWVNSPALGVVQAILLLIVWTHGCLGVHFWLRLKPFYSRAKNLMLAGAVLLPTLALLGYYQGGERTLRLAQDPAWLARATSPDHVGTPAQNADLIDHRTRTLAFLAAALVATLCARGLRRWRESRVGSIRLTYPTARFGAPASACSRQASSTPSHTRMCAAAGAAARRAVSASWGTRRPALPERRGAGGARAGARGSDVRLACQLRPTWDIAFVPMLSPYVATVDARRPGGAHAGIDAIVIMFVDMRGSSRLAEKRLPFDTVFIINQFLNAVSHVVLTPAANRTRCWATACLPSSASANTDIACRQAIAASAGIAERVESLNGALAHGLVEPIRFGIGIHAGVTVAGDIGYERHAEFW